MLPFKHRKLDLQEKEIRLLRLEKTDDEAVPIRLSLRNAILNKRLDLHVLSYAWGDDTPTHNVIIADEDSPEGTFSIRHNLHDFFVAARKSHEPWTTEWIWVDQICIDQDHHEERCHQVAQMTDLYSTAKATILWPGAMPEMRQDLHAVLRSGPMSLRKEELGQMILHWLPAFSKQAYWFRLWIVQEIAFASRVIVFLGLMTCDLSDLRGPYLSEEQWKENLTSAAKPEVKAWHDRIIALAESPRLRNGTWDQVLKVARITNFTEPLDRFYALAGLVREPLRIEPDYTLTRRELMKKVIGTQIAYSKSLGVDGNRNIVRDHLSDFLSALRSELEIPCLDCDFEGLDEEAIDRVAHGEIWVEELCRVFQYLQISFPPEIRGREDISNWHPIEIMELFRSPRLQRKHGDIAEICARKDHNSWTLLDLEDLLRDPSKLRKVNGRSMTM